MPWVAGRRAATEGDAQILGRAYGAAANGARGHWRRWDIGPYISDVIDWRCLSRNCCLRVRVDRQINKRGVSRGASRGVSKTISLTLAKQSVTERGNQDLDQGQQGGQ